MADAGFPIVEFRDVDYDFGGRRILEGVNFLLAAGELLILLGESGCGKTTTLKLINRLIKPSGGEILIEGIPAAEWDEIRLRRRIGYVIQDGGLFPHYTAAENIGLIPRLEKWDTGRLSTRVAEMLGLVGLPPETFADRFPHELSGGQRQRIGVARALAADPDLLLLDEPFGALDAITRTNLQKEFAALVRELGKTAVFVTHDLREAMLLGSRIALMDKGRIVMLGTPDEFMRSDLPLVRDYLGTIA